MTPNRKTMNTSNQPAFPAEYTDHTDPAFPKLTRTLGLTKREWLAGMAMQGILASNHGEYQFHSEDGVASYAKKCADSLLVELSKTEEEPKPPPKPSLPKTLEALVEISAHLYTDQDRARCRGMAADALTEVRALISDSQD